MGMKKWTSACVVCALALIPIVAITPASADKSKTSRFSYTTDWTSRNTTRWEKMFASLRNQQNLKYLEIGVYEGRTLIWVMKTLLPHSSTRATAIDIFDGDLQSRFEKNLAASGIDSHRVEIIKGPSQSKLKSLVEESYDLIYVDGDHRGSAVMADAVLGWSLLKHGGYMVFDDYELQYFSLEEENATIAIDTFVRLYHKELRVVHKGYQYVVQKQKMSNVPANISESDPVKFTKR